MKNTIRKILSVTIVAVMLISMALPCFAQSEEYPTIYVTGAQTNNLYNAESERIYPFATPLTEVAKEALAPCLKKLAVGLVTGNYEEYNEELYGLLSSIFEDVKLDKDGKASDGSHPEYHWSTVGVSSKQSGYGMWDYRFWYDWRLSPIDTAEELKNYIDRVRTATGKDKVQLVGRCYGANVIQTYLALYEEHALENVSDVAYYSSSVTGIDFMSEIFVGEVVFEDDAVENFTKFFLDDINVIKDDTTQALVFTIIELLNEFKILGLSTELIAKIVNDVKDELIPKSVRATLGSWPSYWAMVTPERYEQARDFIFEGCKDEYAEFIKNTDKYYYDVQLTAEETILDLQSKGINFYIFSKYNFPEYPLYEGATAQGDGYTSLYRQSFGALSAPYGEVLSEEYINTVPDKKYLSPDNKIDASTALIPERSWFIKNLHHNYFEVLHPMTLEIMRYDLTVDSEKYQQYIYHENNKLYPITTTDEDFGKTSEGAFDTFIKFFKVLFEFFKKILSGEIPLDGLFG